LDGRNWFAFCVGCLFWSDEFPLEHYIEKTVPLLQKQIGTGRDQISACKQKRCFLQFQSARWFMEYLLRSRFNAYLMIPKAVAVQIDSQQLIGGEPPREMVLQSLRLRGRVLSVPTALFRAAH